MFITTLLLYLTPPITSFRRYLITPLRHFPIIPLPHDLPRYPITPLPSSPHHYFIAFLPHFFATSLPHCPVTSLLGHFVASLLRFCTIAILQGCVAPLLQRFGTLFDSVLRLRHLASWFPHYLIPSLPHRTRTRLPNYLSTNCPIIPLPHDTITSTLAGFIIASLGCFIMHNVIASALHYCIAAWPQFKHILHDAIPSLPDYYTTSSLQYFITSPLQYCIASSLHCCNTSSLIWLLH